MKKKTVILALMCAAALMAGCANAGDSGTENKQ